MITKAMLLSLVLLLMTGSPRADDDGPGCAFIQVLETGQFHGDEVSANTGEEWLGLHVAGSKSLLLRYKLTVETVKTNSQTGRMK